MAGDPRPPSWLPWALCWISLALVFFGLVLRIIFPEGMDDGVLYAAASVPGVALVPLVGAFLATRVPTNPYGWVWCAVGLVLGMRATADGVRRSGAIPAWLGEGLTGAVSEVLVCLLVLVLLLFPTGRLPSRAWRWLPRATVLIAALLVLMLPFAPPADDAGEPSPWSVGGRAGDLLVDIVDNSVYVLFALVLAAAASVLLRFRRAGAVERQQLKWFFLAAALVAGATWLDLLDIVPMSDPVSAIVDAVVFALLPVAVGIAVFRYRLFEIDRIVSRTVSYGLLTGGLVGLYLGLVALLRPLLEPLTGNSALAVAASTLAVAAVFNPVRRRLQSVVDRRFDRARYDAARAVEAFTRRLRDQVDLDEVAAGLRETVGATVAPTRVAVWLRDVPSSGQA